MSQISLYLDSEVYGKAESAAHQKGVPVSRYVETIIREYLSREWPPDYADLFGSVTDETFFPNGAEKMMIDRIGKQASL